MTVWGDGYQINRQRMILSMSQRIAHVCQVITQNQSALLCG